jgi:hypothetical protein
VLVLVKSYDEFRHGREPLPVFLFWLLMWSLVVLVAIFPEITSWLRTQVFGAGTGIGTFLGIGFVFLLFLSYRLYIKAERAERRINALISHVTLKKLESEPSDD